MLKPWSIQ